MKKLVLLALAAVLAPTVSFAKTRPVNLGTAYANSRAQTFNTTGIGNVRGITITAVQGAVILEDALINGNQYAQFNEAICQRLPAVILPGYSCTVSTYVSPSNITFYTHADRRDRNAYYSVVALVKK